MKYGLSALITKEDDWYIARCPELSVTTQGATIEAASANLDEAVELYIESFGITCAQTEESPANSGRSR